MIGPGTGIAPMRALIQERLYQYQKLTSTSTSSVKPPSNVLYFGCKRNDEDFIYANELREYEQNGALSKLHLAFSRETKDKVYMCMYVYVCTYMYMYIL